MPQAASREHDVRQAAADLLAATNQFDAVYHYSAPEEFGQKAGQLRAAVVAPVKGDYSQPWDDVTTGRPLCRVSFNVVVTSRHEDPIVRDSAADQMLAVVLNTLNGASLAGITFVQQTLATGSTWLPETPPERRVRVAVSAAYEAPGFNSFNTSE